MPKPPHPFNESLKNGFMWMVIFTIIFLMFCKWFSGA